LPRKHARHIAVPEDDDAGRYMAPARSRCGWQIVPAGAIVFPEFWESHWMLAGPGIRHVQLFCRALFVLTRYRPAHETNCKLTDVRGSDPIF
jgi:hypothetical protein